MIPGAVPFNKWYSSSNQLQALDAVGYEGAEPDLQRFAVAHGRKRIRAIVRTRLRGSLRFSRSQPLGTVGRQLGADRQFGAVCQELGVHHSASTLHIPWAVIASPPASGGRVVSAVV
jgi:hypothetical protein